MLSASLVTKQHLFTSSLIEFYFGECIVIWWKFYTSYDFREWPVAIQLYLVLETFCKMNK